MTQAGFYQQQRMRPGALAIVVLLHGAGITALALAKEGNFIHDTFVPTIVRNIPVEKPPPEKPKPQPRQPQQPEVITQVKPLIDVPIPDKLPPPPTMPPPPRAESQPGPKVIDAPPAPPPPPPPPPPPVKLESARAKGNLASYVSDSDYPSDAIRREEQGTTRFRLAVGPDGRVQDCKVTGSSGSSSLDAATCRLMKSRARFSPARDSTGNAVADAVSSAISWRLPSG